MKQFNIFSQENAAEMIRETRCIFRTQFNIYTFTKQLHRRYSTGFYICYWKFSKYLPYRCSTNVDAYFS